MKRGDRFTHKHFTTPDGRPLRCKVTLVAHGVIYFRPIYEDGDGTESLGASCYFTAEQIDRYAKIDA